MENKIRLAGILKETLANGPGMRRVFFSQGCKHNCPGCFNLETHDFQEGFLWDMDDLIKDVKDNPLLRGVTFSGGDPWEQADKFAYMAKELKKSINKDKFDIWCYTGYTFEYILKNRHNRQGWDELLSNIDVLVDGRFEEDKKEEGLRFRGSTNQRIIDVKESLNQNKIVILNY